MAVSVRMDPLLERELELEARRRGITKSQFIVAAVERALGRRNPYELLVALQAEEARGTFGAPPPPGTAREAPYETDASKSALRAKLKAKHGVGGTR